jgi:hypothetical protein
MGALELISAEKTCGRCKTVKLKENFYLRRSARDGLAPYCKECDSARNGAYRRLSPEKKRQYELKKKFGLTLEAYNSLFVAQHGRCALCETHQSELKKSLAVDHDHDTGAIRGLLCHNCNVGLGNLKDSAELLIKAAEYVSTRAFGSLKVIPGGGN